MTEKERYANRETALIMMSRAGLCAGDIIRLEDAIVDYDMTPALSL